MVRVTINTVGDFMKAIASARKAWHRPEGEELWFRGEDRKYKTTTLQPKLYRHLPDNVKSASLTLLRQERSFFEEFVRRGVEIYGKEADSWDWYLLMQHHSAPTRLLDWTDGAMMALHFATNGDLRTTEGGFVYVLDPYWLNDYLGDLPVHKQFKKDWKIYKKWRREEGYSLPGPWDTVYRPGGNSLKKNSRRPRLPNEPMVMEFPLMTRRFSAQHSRLIVMGRDRFWLRDWGMKREARIKRLEIPKNKVAEFRIQLRDAGISESVIYPDLDGLGRELLQLWDQLKRKRRFNK